jgi:hypothetical protein
MPKTFVALLVALLLIPTGGFAQTWPPGDDPGGTILIPAIRFPADVVRQTPAGEPGGLAARRPALHQQRRPERSR